MINFFKKQNNKKGFSLVETLVALFVFSIAITATMAVMSQGVSSITNSKNKITASFLAQEGTEYFRNIRDSFYLSLDYENRDIAWQSFVSTVWGSCSVDGCGVVLLDDRLSSFSLEEILSLAIFSCSSSDCNFKYYPQTGSYIQTPSGGSGVSTILNRKIYFEKLDNDNTLKITSEVSYIQGGRTNKVSFTDYLTNWAE